MAILLSSMRSAVCVAASMLFLPHISASSAAAAEIIVESVKPAHSGTAVNSYGVTRTDFKRIVSSIPAIQELIPVRIMPQQAVNGEREMDIELIGTAHRLAKLDQLKTTSGRFLTAKDVTNKNNIAVIDSFTARQLFPGEDAIGKNIRVADHYFLIVGQLAASPGAETTRAKQGRIYIPLTTMRTRYGDTVIQRRTGSFQAERYELSRIRAVVKSADAKQVATVIEALMKKFHEESDYSIRVVHPTLNPQH